MKLINNTKGRRMLLICDQGGWVFLFSRGNKMIKQEWRRENVVFNGFKINQVKPMYPHAQVMDRQRQDLPSECEKYIHEYYHGD